MKKGILVCALCLLLTACGGSAEKNADSADTTTNTAAVTTGTQSGTQTSVATTIGGTTGVTGTTTAPQTTSGSAAGTTSNQTTTSGHTTISGNTATNPPSTSTDAPATTPKTPDTEEPEEPDYVLPEVRIDTVKIAKIAFDVYSDCTVKITAGTDTAIQNTGAMSARIKGRGHSTWKWDKKPYKIKLDTKASLLGMNADKEWVLLAEYADKTLMRNQIGFAMSDYLGSMIYTPDAVSVSLYIDGKYQGVYTVCEEIEVNDNKVNIAEDYNINDTGYLLEIGGRNDEVDVKGRDYFFSNKNTVRSCRIQSPDTEKMSTAQYNFIKGYVNSAEAAVIAKSGYEKYIDVDSFIDWFILEEMAYNVDCAFRRSCFLTKPAGGKLEMGPVWDFDLAFGNFSVYMNNYDDWATLGVDDKDAYVKLTWYNYLLEDPAFRQKARTRWDAVKNGLLDNAYAAIDANYEKLSDAQEDNFDKWDILNIRVGFERKDVTKYNTYDKQVKYLKDFIKTRYDWIDKNL
ncbi:MAG: CotH kinase family protein [Oscillospiraceae bacterium]